MEPPVARPPLLARTLQRLAASPRVFRWGLTLYPPYILAGIVCTHISDDYREIDVELRMHPWNRNFVGTHFGGSLFSMTDPFYMLMLLRILGKQAVVWDKAATIRFRRPGKGTVRCAFRIDPERLDAIRARLDASDAPFDEVFQVQVLDAQDRVVAEVDKTLYLRRA